MLAVWALMGTWPNGAWTQEALPEPSDAEANAQALVDAGLRAVETATEAQLEEDLDTWARSVIEQALSNAPVGSPVAPVPAEEHAALVAEAVAGTQNDGLASARTEVIVFMSLSVPEASWRQWSREAARIGAPLVLRGVAAGGFTDTVARLRERTVPAQGADDLRSAAPLQGAARLQGAALDPRLFRLFRVEHVPAVAVVPGGVPPCQSRGCSSDPVPPHDLVTGNVGLESALDIVAREGGPGRDSARRHLAALRGEIN